MESDGREEEQDEPTAVEEVAGEQLGVERWDRPLIFRDAADAGTDSGLPYWIVLILSGAIATLGLALNSTAVVIGAMLVAPLLGPIMGLSMALAVGDSRLALQCFAVVAGSLVAVIATAAGLTALLPFNTLTLEISSRIHPTTLDMGVAVCSGLVGALVTVARGKRLSAAIPGVAVAVALIPPLAVAGFGIGAGWYADVIRGSLLLLGANLAGIVLSGVLLFMLVGMHRGEVVDAARRWHEETPLHGVAGLVSRIPWMSRAGVFGSASGRAALVIGFVVMLAFPLTAALKEVIREARVNGAVAEAVQQFEADGSTSVVWQQVDVGSDSSVARVRVTTAVGVGADAREAFQRRATELAGEPIHLRLEQMPVSAGGASALQSLLRGGGGRDGAADDATWPETLARAREALQQAAWSLQLQTDAEAIGVALHVEGGDAGAADSVEVAYLAGSPLEPQAVEVLGGVLRRAVGHPGLRTSFHHAGPVVLAMDPTDTEALNALIGVLLRYPSLRLDMYSAASDSVAAAAALAAIGAAGVAADRVEARSHTGPVVLRVRRPPDSSAPE
ncbi:hypothetical protein BH23GEM10_BH23GEM10_16210 [soil metagenome]